jgi:hypothetical protein
MSLGWRSDVLWMCCDLGLGRCGHPTRMLKTPLDKATDKIRDVTLAGRRCRGFRQGSDRDAIELCDAQQRRAAPHPLSLHAVEGFFALTIDLSPPGNPRGDVSCARFRARHHHGRVCLPNLYHRTRRFLFMSDTHNLLLKPGFRPMNDGDADKHP